MKVSVILCTYNRCQSLAKTLESVAASKISEALSWEVLVVDNNSSDRTREVVDEWRRGHPWFHYIFESRQGLSHARNAGIRAATGDVLAFIDDDVIAEPTWLQNLAMAFCDAESAAVGGRILPPESFSPPRWLSVRRQHALAPLALFDLGAEGGLSDEPPFGANMAFRKTVFEKHGCFRTDLGRQPGSLMSNEDTEFGQRLLSCGDRVRYEPSAVVYHPVSPERLRKDYFLRWQFDKARSDVRQSGVPGATNWRIAGVPVCLFRRLVGWTLRWMFTLRPDKRFDCKLGVWANSGAIRESYLLARAARV